MKKQRNKKDNDISLELTDKICEMFGSCGSTQDPSGSYTGTSLWGDETPTQDADDL